MSECSSLVSVIIPAYNAGRFLREAVDSVLGQGYRPLEVIVVDDGSNDDTAQVAREYGPRIVFLSQPNRGSSAARNRGIAAAAGAFYAFLDADDLFCAGKIARQVEELARDPRLDVVFGHMINFHDWPAGTGPPAAPATREIPMPGALPGTLLIRRAAFHKVGPFDETILTGECIIWMIRAREFGLREKMLPEVLLRRRVHGENSGILGREAQHQSYLRILKAALDRRRTARPPEG